MHEPEPLHLLTGSDASRLVRGLVVLGAVVVLGVVVFGAYAIGREGSDVVELTGRAEVGERTASIRANGTRYVVADSVAWIDAACAVHDGGWPACLDVPATTVRDVRFAAVTVPVADGADVTSVVYVDCRPSEA